MLFSFVLNAEVIMNRIYKVIWSRVKHAYVIVSELTKNHGKNTGNGVAVYGAKMMPALLAAIALTGGTGLTVQANSIQIGGVQSDIHVTGNQYVTVATAATDSLKGFQLYNYGNPGNPKSPDEILVTAGDYSNYSNFAGR